MGAASRLRALVVDDMQVRLDCARERTLLERGSRSLTSVLLVQVNRVILGRLLQSFGFDVCYSKDGLEAFEFFKEQGTDISCVWMVRLYLIPKFRGCAPHTPGYY